MSFVLPVFASDSLTITDCTAAVANGTPGPDAFATAACVCEKVNASKSSLWFAAPPLNEPDASAPFSVPAAWKGPVSTESDDGDAALAMSASPVPAPPVPVPPSLTVVCPR